MIRHLKKVVQLKKNQQIGSKLLFDSIPRRLWKEKLPFNRKKPPAEPGSGRAAICLDQLGVERTCLPLQSYQDISFHLMSQNQRIAQPGLMKQIMNNTPSPVPYHYNAL